MLPYLENEGFLAKKQKQNPNNTLCGNLLLD